MIKSPVELQLEQMQRMIKQIDAAFNEEIEEFVGTEKYQKIINLIKIAIDRNALFFEYMNILEENEVADSKIKKLILPS